ncbi:D-alanyl-D-alanine carboxypeptidase family protein [Brevibacillus ginsengisoli]|uniref:M15 family metallopeptidase n=1 Tax=Brevibacillus ginsengisoli TaxID=363854 RepID=UPI003CECF5F8
MNKFYKLSLLATTTILSSIMLSGCQTSPLNSSLPNNQSGQTAQPAQPSDTAPAPSPSDKGSVTPAPPSDSPQSPTSTSGQSNEGTVPSSTYLKDTVRMVNGVPTVTNPQDLLVVVDKQRSLPSSYIPEGLVEPNVPFPFQEKSEKRLMRPEAAKALEELFAGAQKDNITLYGCSGYRSYKTQKGLFDTYVKTQGPEHAAQFSAVPGKSEHQTGLAIDVSGADSKTRLEQSFGKTPEGLWLKEHCAEYGFIIRYPKGKEAITGYAYEPWHIRYVGKKVAQEITQRGTTLEQYFQNAVPAGTNN